MNLAPLRRHRRPLLVAAGAVGAVVNANFLLAGPVGSPVDLTTGVISELAVHGLPGWWMFRFGDGSAGVLGAVLGVVVWRAGRRASGVALGAFGVGTFLSALVPLTCAPSLSTCAAAARTPEFVHDAVSVVGTTGAVVAALLLLLQWRGRGPVLRGAALLAVLGTALPGLGQVVDVVVGGAGGGAVQQLQVLSVSLWLLLEGIAAARSAAGAGRVGRLVPASVVRAVNGRRAPCAK